MRNIEEVFIEKGYTKIEIHNAMKESAPADGEDQTEEERSRRIVSIPSVQIFTRAFGRIAKQHRFTTAS